MRKKIGSWLLLLFVMVLIGSVASAGSSSVRIIQNGQEVRFLEGEGQVVVDENNRTLVPVRKVAGILGAEVDWNPETRTVSVKKGEVILHVTVGDKVMINGDQVILMDTAAKIIDNRTYLPLRAISENLGFRVLWDAEARTIGFEAAAAEQTRTFLSQLDAPAAGDLVAVMKTSLGDIRIKLLREDAPKAVENFVGLAQKGYYDHLIFHRVIPNFMIQSGDPNGNGTGGQSIWGTPFADEFSDTAHNFRGALSMANSGPTTNGSQFFIVQLPATALQSSMFPSGTPDSLADTYTRIGGTPWLDGKHTVFGQVVSGMDVVDRIAGMKTAAGDKPLEDVTILSVMIETVK